MGTSPQSRKCRIRTARGVLRSACGGVHLIHYRSSWPSTQIKQIKHQRQHLNSEVESARLVSTPLPLLVPVLLRGA